MVDYLLREGREGWSCICLKTKCKNRLLLSVCILPPRWYIQTREQGERRSNWMHWLRAKIRNWTHCSVKHTDNPPCYNILFFVPFVCFGEEWFCSGLLCLFVRWFYRSFNRKHTTAKHLKEISNSFSRAYIRDHGTLMGRDRRDGTRGTGLWEGRDYVRV